MKMESALPSQKLSEIKGKQTTTLLCTCLSWCPNTRCFCCCWFSVRRLGSNHVYTGIQQLAEISACICLDILTILFSPTWQTDERRHQWCQLKSGWSFSLQLLLLLKAFSATEATGELRFKQTTKHDHHVSGLQSVQIQSNHHPPDSDHTGYVLQLQATSARY